MKNYDFVASVNWERVELPKMTSDAMPYGILSVSYFSKWNLCDRSYLYRIMFLILELQSLVEVNSCDSYTSMFAGQIPVTEDLLQLVWFRAFIFWSETAKRSEKEAKRSLPLGGRLSIFSYTGC